MPCCVKSSIEGDDPALPKSADLAELKPNLAHNAKVMSRAIDVMMRPHAALLCAIAPKSF